MPIPSNRSYVGIAKELTRGTAVAPTYSIPVTAVSVHDEITQLLDTGLRGSMVDFFSATPGQAWSTWGCTGFSYPDTIGFWLASVLPDVVTTGAGPYVHVFAPLNSGSGQPKGYSIADYSGLGATSGARYFPGAGVTDLTFKYDAMGTLTYDVKTVAYPSSLVPTAAPTKTFGTLLPTPGYFPTITIGGGAVTNVQSGDIKISRPITAIHAATGSAAPYNLFSGPVSVSGNMLVVAEDETELLRYLNSTQPSLDINFAGTSGVNTGTILNFHSTSVVYTPADVVRGKDYVEVQIAWKARANTTDVGASTGYSAMKVSLTNTLPSGTFA